MENPGKETYVEQMERVNQTNPFMLHNRIRAVALSEDRAEVRAAGLVTRNDGRKYVTLDSSFRFLRGSSAKNIQGLAKITKRGKTVCFTKAEVVETDTGKLLAEGEFTFYCMGE